MKNSNDTIGNRTRDLPTCSAVPQPTALPRAPCTWCAHTFLCYLSTKFHKPRKNWPLVDTVKPQGKTVLDGHHIVFAHPTRTFPWQKLHIFQRSTAVHQFCTKSGTTCSSWLICGFIHYVYRKWASAVQWHNASIIFCETSIGTNTRDKEYARTAGRWFHIH